MAAKGSQASVKLTAAELDRALAVLEAHPPGAFVPRPFEYDCIRHSWDKIRPRLEGVDLLSHTPRAASTLLAPKQRYTVRPVQVLDPLDEILYTGLVIRIGSAIESARLPMSKRVAFSHRFSTTSATAFYEEHPTWNEFEDEIATRSRSADYVATADIVDFYPRVNHHRLENSLKDMCGAAHEYEIRALMALLSDWSGRNSYGIPTGPAASALLAEAALHEVDDFLASRGIDFVRWVDDYRIFGKSEADCLRSLYQLGARLLSTQGLSLNMAKTRVVAVDAYHKISPGAELRETVWRKVFGGNPYAEVDFDSLNDEQKKLIGEVDAQALLQKALVSGEVADFRVVAFVLSVLTAFRRPELAEVVLSHLERLAPISEAVARFLNVFDKVSSAERGRLGGALVKFWTEAPLVPEYQLMWLLQPFTKATEWNHVDDIRRLAASNESVFVRRQAILAIGESGRRPAILDVRGKVGDAPEWERRAALFACRKLPRDEREVIARVVLDATGNWDLGSCVMRAIALDVAS